MPTRGDSGGRARPARPRPADGERSAARLAKVQDAGVHEGGDEEADGSYVMPIVHTRLPETVVDAGFWVGLVGSAALGVIDPPLALLVGAGVLVARHRSGA